VRGYLRKALLVIILLGAGIGILHWQLLEKQRLGFPGRRSFSRADFPPAAAVWTRANPVDPVSPALEALEPQAAPEALETREYPTPEESVVISEINYHPPRGDRREEWMELVNRSKKAVDMSGWKLTGHGKGRPSCAGIHFTFPEGTVLEPG